MSSIRINELSLPEKFKFPLMAKSSVGGYDGKGTKVIKGYSELKNFLIFLTNSGVLRSILGIFDYYHWNNRVNCYGLCSRI